MILVMIGLSCVTTLIYANSEQMNETLVRIIHQLQAIKPLIAKAEEEQPKTHGLKYILIDFKRRMVSGITAYVKILMT